MTLDQASCSDDSSIRLWDMNTGNIKFLIKRRSKVKNAL
ncbi:unnamed protein product [Paramecium octaurelia]|uniref:Uncharacterized protein n=1 Tax=Paramecium octaurelia TaxID=43137 RepID=A0A8S1YQR8_PAROT|nr:unnamed protein product [Paramecium octaurelia]